MKVSQNSRTHTKPLILLLVAIALFIVQFFVGNTRRPALTLLAGLMDALAIILFIIAIVGFVRVRRNSNAFMADSESRKSGKWFKNPNVLAQYEKLVTKPLWRLFKVIYVMIGIVLIGLAFANSYNVTCNDQLQAVWNSIPDWRQRPVSVPCKAAPTLLSGLWGGVATAIGLIILYLLFRRLAAYVAYGKPAQN